jgi:4-hydroxybenzoate polyprenyltransferase
MNVDAWVSLIFAFFSFSFCASSSYIVNDLLDLESDRQHHRKRNRPFANGRIEVWKGILLIPFLLFASVGLACQVNRIFLLCLFMYFLLTCIYSFRLKRLILIDCLTLAVLYTLRIISGNAAINTPLSFWLLAFSVFLFLSLSFVKRYAELQLQVLSARQEIHGRGYYTSDAPLVQMFGVATGYVAVLVLALYINSDAVMKLYLTPEIVWGAVPIMLYWISWMWIQAHRGKMHDDPLIFAIKDKASLIAGALFAITLVLGTMGWAW